MSEYYGVSTPTESYLVHYGVRGMKWGIRRALRSGNSDKLRKQYFKAVKKLGKMSLKANNAVNEKKYDEWRSRARKNAVAGAIGGATGGVIGTLHGAASAGAKYGMTLPDVLKNVPQVKSIAGQFAGAGLIGGGLGGYLGGRARASIYKRRQNPEVRKKLINQRNEWRKEMESAFKGTKYGGKQQKQFHKEISRLSEVSNPRNYVDGQIAQVRRQSKNTYKKRKRG